MKLMLCPCGAVEPLRSNRQKWCRNCAAEYNRQCARRNGREARAKRGVSQVGCTSECQGCGRVFMKKKPNHQYCTVTCRENNRKRREARRQNATTRGVMPEKGDPFKGVKFT